MATKQKIIKELFDALKAKKILVPDDRYDGGIYKVADGFVIRITWDVKRGYERDVIYMYENNSGKITVEYNEWDDSESENYSTKHELDDVVVYRMFTETDFFI